MTSQEALPANTNRVTDKGNKLRRFNGQVEEKDNRRELISAVKANKRLSNKERFKTLCNIFSRDDRVLIVIVADPDSMASALCLKRILSRRVKEVVIAHPNYIKRVNNLAMRDLLKIPLTRLKNVKPDQFTKKVIIDSQPTHHPDFEKIDFDVVIDHHPLTVDWTASFIDIRPEYGAVASMMTEYLKAARIKPSVALSTALFYGIKVDTQNFTRKASYADVLCFQHLFKRINQNLLKKIETADIRRSELKYFRFALENMKMSKNRIYVHLGRVGNPDILVVVADFLSHVHEIGWVIISGQYGEKLIVIFRSDGYKKDAGKLAEKVFGKVGSAGGHRQSARAEVPFKNLKDIDPSTFETKTLQRFLKSLLK